MTVGTLNHVSGQVDSLRWVGKLMTRDKLINSWQWVS